MKKTHCLATLSNPTNTYGLKPYFYIIRWERSLLCCAESLSRVWLFVTPWTVAHQPPLSMGILQARILEWVAISSSRGSSQPRDWTQVSHIAGGFFTIWATWEAQEYWSG